MLDTKAIKICLFLAGSLICGVKSECTVTVDGDAPVFSKSLGSKTLILRNGQRSLVLKRGETLRADCPRQISVRSQDYNNRDIISDSEAKVLLKCDWQSDYRAERIWYKTREDYSYSYTSHPSITLHCIQGKRQLFESNLTLPSCSSYISYIIGTQSAWRDPIVSASICFDLANLAVKYVKYLPNRAEYEFSEMKDKPLSVNLGLSAPIEGFDILFKNSATFDSSINVYKMNNQLLDLHEFNYMSLLQDPQILTELDDFSYIFKTIWWSNLRKGTWKFFLEALKSRSEVGKYEMYTGTSGVMKIPSSIECKQLEDFIVTHEEREVRAPEVIWAYLRSIKENDTEEFVFIGHNTPFSLATKPQQICKNICDEITWLNGTLFSKVHLMPTFGIVECCHPNEVHTKLTGFPVNFFNDSETTTESEIE